MEISASNSVNTGIESGDKVRLSTRRGSIEVPVKISNAVNPGLIFVPIHFGENPANILTNPACDPIAKIPEFKVCAARMEKLTG